MTVKGIVQNGVVVPNEDIAEYNGREVEILLLSGSEGAAQPPPDTGAAGSLDDLIALIERVRMDIGMPDFADEHDHYIHGSPKRGDPL